MARQSRNQRKNGNFTAETLRTQSSKKFLMKTFLCASAVRHPKFCASRANLLV